MINKCEFKEKSLAFKQLRGHSLDLHGLNRGTPCKRYGGGQQHGPGFDPCEGLGQQSGQGPQGLATSTH